MAFTNTQTYSFTKVPRYLEKKWESCALDENLNPVSEFAHQHHRSGTIESITLAVEYEQSLGVTQDVFTARDDAQDDAIEIWQEQRKTWMILEEAISTAVATYSRALAERVKDKSSKLRTFDAPLRQVTTCKDDPPERQDSPIDLMRSVPHTILNVPQTIIPSDSVSNVGIADLAELMQGFLRSPPPKRRRHKSNTAYSIASTFIPKGKEVIMRK